VGRPAALTIVAAVVLLIALALLFAVRRSIGRATGPVVLAALRTDRALALTLFACLLGIGTLVAAAAVGLPLARDLLVCALVLDIAATVITRLMFRAERRRSARRSS
jgi:DMSO reductase anchor subunit